MAGPAATPVTPAASPSLPLGLDKAGPAPASPPGPDRRLALLAKVASVEPVTKQPQLPAVALPVAVSPALVPPTKRPGLGELAALARPATRPVSPSAAAAFPVAPLSPTARTRTEARAVALAHAGSYLAVCFPGQTNLSILDKSSVVQRIDAAQHDGLLVVPLPGDEPSGWQQTLQQTLAAMSAGGWLGKPGSEEALARSQQAQRQAQADADQIARQKINRAVMRVLLGSGQDQGKSTPP